MPDTDRSHVIAALDAAWRQTAKDPNWGLPLDRPDVSGQRDNLLRLAMGLVWAVKELDEQPDFNDITMGDAPAEGTRSTSQTSNFRSLIRHLDDSLDAVLGQHVRRLRLLGVPWNKIGLACGMTAQGIYKKASQRNWIAFTDDGPE